MQTVTQAISELRAHLSGITLFTAGRGAKDAAVGLVLKLSYFAAMMPEWYLFLCVSLMPIVFRWLMNGR